MQYIVAVIIVVAAAYVVWTVIRRLTGKGSCGCCPHKDQCPSDHGPDK